MLRRLLAAAFLAAVIGTSVCSSSGLAKFVRIFSRPGAFNQSSPAFGLSEEPPTSCPPGEEGLECRRAEARRITDNCPTGGDCLWCVHCDEARALDWPRCCQHGGRCCYQLVSACNSCNVTQLRPFCSKHLKRCFQD